MRREYPKVPGPGRAIVISLLVLAIVALAADFGLRIYTEQRLASSAQELYGLPDRPDLNLSGFPFLLQVARGRFEEVSVAVQDVRVEGLAIDRVELHFQDASFPRGAVFAGGGTVTSRGGRAEAEITEDDLSSYVQEELGVAVRVRLLGPGIRVSTRFSTEGSLTTATAEGELELDGGALVFAPTEVEVEGTFGVPASALAFDAPLPDLVPGVTYERLVIEDGVARVEADLAGAQFEIV